ncbi:tetraacyldisaccharide 4'-kinase [Pseudothauera rhizosphaerae]|uniref:Tetraacyldisaccharide 4'-kinase n=1 Tax=Pseudothauera rhizosphaerae TaxID=2565932 RepID=A0A4V3WBK0_9RHOO|nr:tetraacyldisaccharide 4'-kinase [Pseudothauera rhizosphaerae]THF63513.1 tetraacyldisaccharide 4'-kinase [Pseudothauera rhizosphaerae]
MTGRAPAFWAQRGPLARLLLPLSLVFIVLAALRRGLYRLGVLRVERLPVPVIVVGNIAVGGSGKTPVAHWLVERLRTAGRRPGIVSRGYGGRIEGTALVPPDGDPAVYGDEPVLLARLTGCPVAVGADRPAAAHALLAEHPECDLIVCDDGLQHYRLARDVELAVVDEATLGNRWRLPAGPLREGLGRLREVDLVLAHGELSPALQERLPGRAVFPMQLSGQVFRALDGSGREVGAEHFHGRTVHAYAGIGRPERFFAHLRALGLAVVGHAFPDHHRYRPEDLAAEEGSARVMTSKDAVKCAAFAPADCWELPVVADIPPGAAERILETLSHGRQTA